MRVERREGREGREVTPRQNKEKKEGKTRGAVKARQRNKKTVHTAMRKFWELKRVFLFQYVEL